MSDETDDPRTLFEPGGQLHDQLLSFVEHVKRADQQPPDWSVVPWGNSGMWAVIDNCGQDGDREVAHGFDTKAEAEAYLVEQVQAWVRRHRGEAS